MADTKYAPYNVLATYRSPDDARAAITALERDGGVEAGDIELLGADGVGAPVTNEAQRDVDMAATGAVGKRFGSGFLVGALLGGLLGLLVAFIAFGVLDVADDMQAGGWIASVLGFAALGGMLGAFWGGATGLPVSDAWGETFEAVKTGSACVAVHTHQQAEAEAALEALRKTKPAKLGRFGSDGKLEEVRAA